VRRCEPMSSDLKALCSGCGLMVPGGEPGCQALFAELLARSFSDLAYGRFHRILVDTYSLQHPERYCASARSPAAHLGGLCCGLEHGGHPATCEGLRCRQPRRRVR
jgi:hypothetical protein